MSSVRSLKWQRHDVMLEQAVVIFVLVKLFKSV